MRETGFAEYFLIVMDFSQFAAREGIAKTVRGSAAGSLILFCLGITDIDPLEYKLVFERFLNPERREMPDIDMDFADNRRDEVIRYVAEKYGRDRVAQIITFGTLGAKAAIRDTGRALGMGLSDVDRIARLIPNQLNITLKQAVAQTSELRDAGRSDPDVQELLDQAQRLNGVVRHASTHAAAVVISRDPLSENVPLRRPVNESDESESIPMTQWAMDQCAAVGLLKMDFLGLTNLTILNAAVELVRKHEGVEIDPLTLPTATPRPTPCSPAARHSASSSSNPAACAARSPTSSPSPSTISPPSSPSTDRSDGAHPALHRQQARSRAGHLSPTPTSQRASTTPME